MKFSASTDYKYPTVVRHQGVSIVLALRTEQLQDKDVSSIYYRVLTPDPTQPDDDKNWSDRKKLSFPDQIRPAGMSLVTVGLKTAERTADAPFQALSDGKHVYLFRQSTDGALYVDRFVFDPAPKTLNPTWEARFQRSRKRDIPASRKDTLGARDMEGEPFLEPTTELTVVKGLQHGRFCVLLLPGRLPSEWRWQIFVTNSKGEIDSFSIRRGEDGLFDVADVQRTSFKWADGGRRFQTGPAALLYMQQEEAQDEYGRPQRVKRGTRVMLAAPVGSARYALELDGVNDYVSLGNPGSLQIEGAITIEAWVKVQATDGRQDIVAHGTGGVSLRIQDGQYQIGMGDQCASHAIPREDVGTWIHLAGAYDGKHWLLYRNGKVAAQEADPTGAATVEEDWTIGKSFAGQINNVRLWNVARSQEDIQEDMHDPLEGDEPGLVGYWPFDEGSGDAIHDQVCGNHGQLYVGLALELDGVDDYVEIPALDLSGSTTMTIEAWIKPADITTNKFYEIVRQEGAEWQPDWLLAFQEKGQILSFGLFAGGSYQELHVPIRPTDYTDGKWHHLTATYDGQTQRLYRDGDEIGSKPKTGHIRFSANAVHSIGSHSGKWEFFKGQIGQVCLWNVARTPQDIQQDKSDYLTGDESGLAACWSLDEGAGVTIHDQAADHHGQLNVGFGYALDFDGVDDYVSIPAINLNAYNTMSIEAWVKPADITTNKFYEIVRQEGAEWQPDWLLAFQEKGQILSFGLFAGGSYQELDVDITPTDYTDGKWHHIAATYDGQTQRLYRDGDEIGSKSKTGHIRFSANAVHSIGSHSGKSEFFKGQIGQVCLWNVARTPEDIQQDKSDYLTGDESGLAACWSLDQGAGDTIYDLASGNHGQFYAGSGDNLERKWVKGPRPDDVSTKWGVGPDNPNDKWVVMPPIAILDFGVSRQGTLALIGDLEDRSEVTLAQQQMHAALSGDDDAALLPIPVVEADDSGAAPMRTIAVDKKGLTVSAGLLNFDLSRTGDTPFLLDGADGLIHLYFRGDYGQFLVAQHDTLTARAEYIAPLNDTDATDDGPRLHFTARRPGTQMQGYEITITNGSHSHTCQVTIDNQNGISETWQNVPRDLESFLAVLNGTATNDANDPLVKEGELVCYDYGNVQRKGVPDDLASGDEPFGSTLFAVGAENLPDTGVPIRVRNVAAAEMTAQPGRDCAWIPGPQGKALWFDGANHYVALPHDKLTIAGDLTVEAWVKVTEGTDSSDSLRLVNYRSEGPRFTLGLIKDKEGDGYKVFAPSEDKAVQTADAQVSPEEWTHLAAVYNATTALKLDGQGYVDCGNDVSLDMTEAVTIEAWVTPEREGSERLQPEVVLSKWGAAEEEQSWRLYIDTDDKPCFETRDQDRKVIRVKANVPLAANRPYHLAGVFASPREEWVLEFDDGQRDHVSLGNPEVLNFAGEITIEAWVRVQATDGLRNIVAHGHHGSREVFLRIRDGMYEIGSWNGQDHKTSYRMPPEDMDTWVHLAGVYDSEQQAWILYRNGIEVSRTQESTGAIQVNAGWAIGARGTGTERFFKGQINNVRIWKSALPIKDIRENMDKPAEEVEDTVGHWVFDGTDQIVKQVQDHSGNMNHGTLQGGLKADSFKKVDKCRYEQKIWVNGDLQGWRWVTIDDGKAPGYLASYRLTPSDTAIRLGPGPDGPVNEVIVGDYLLLQDEQVVVRQAEVDSVGNETYYNLVVDRAVNGIAREHRRNTEVYFLKRGANKVASTTAKVNIGRSASDEGYFQGTMDDVRLWNVGRRDWQIRYYRDEALPEDAEGVSEWCFEEGRGKTAIDSKGSNHGRLVHPESDEIEHMWTPAARNAKLTLYVNGRPVQTDEELGPDHFGGYGTTDQFTIGAMIAMIGEDQTPQQHMSGCIDEVRVWNEVRSPEQIRDNMYRALSGAEEGLAGYWPLDEGTGTAIRDQTGNGQDGTVKEEQWVDSTAPIGNEGPEVRNVYGVAKPGFNKQIVGPPSAVEYGDMQWDDEGNLFGVMKRCYIFQGDALQLVTGFKVGDLELNFIGQVQTAPTLIGYIEGAPPVPSENLTVNDPEEDDYVGTSTIELTEAKETTQVYSASRDTGFDMSVEFKAGLHWARGTAAGVFVSTDVFATEGKVGAHAYFEHSMGHLSSASKTAGTSKTLTKSLTLGGGWEEAQDYDQNGQLRYLNTEVGRRYLPNNMGYALVKSATADLFALRLKRTGSLVAFQVLPNPDIPEDWNIIMFPLNPKYAKNGTLDGMVGLVPDPDYPGAIAGERGSYFKPLEAYALKERIEREAERIEGYYATFAAEEAAGIFTGKDGPLSELPGGGLGYDWETGRDKRSMANTYVWTADGGFYAEEEQFSSIRQESLGSSYHFLGKGGVYAEAKFAAGLGFFFELDALFGGHINTTVQKSEEEKAAFGLHVDVQGEGFLNYWDPEDKEYKAWPCPGKVDAYRFMTFYLAPQPSNFDQFFDYIVDPEWLSGQGKYAGEYGPNARALREARSKPNEVWRVLHRVTYVSRIPPQFEPTPVEAVAEDVRRPANVEANIGLIREIEKIKHLLPPIPDESHLMLLGRAVDSLLFGDASGNGQGQSELEKIVPWWADRDEDVKREIRQDLMTYLKAVYESDVPLPEIEGDKQRVTEGLQVLYTFKEGKGKRVHDVSNVRKLLHLKVEEGAVKWIPGGLRIREKTLVATSGPATKLIKAAKASDEITIEAWVKPANTTQSGPARIVTLSLNPNKRNFTLAQDGAKYIVRLRTTATNKNGLLPGDLPPLSTPDAALTTQLTHVVFTRNKSGKARLYLNGKVVGKNEVGGEFKTSWDDGYRFGLGDEFTGEKRYWQGDLHLVAIYSRALKPDEVSQNFEAGLD